LAPPDRTTATLHDTLRDVWRAERRRPENAPLFASRDEERKWGLECLHLLDNYFRLEDPARLPTGEPLAVEAWLSADLSASGASVSAGRAARTGGVRLVGKVDRLDAMAAVSADGLTIVDYKTGRAPPQKYSPATNARIRAESFFQLRCYALLLDRGGPPRGFDRARADPIAKRLRLVYLADGEDGGNDPAAEPKS